MPGSNGAVEAQDAAAKESSKDSLDLQSFDRVWSLIKQRHWDADLVGKSWDDARDRLRPEVIEAKDTAAARAITRKLIETLQQSHFAIVPAPTYSQLQNDDEDAGGGEAYTGIVVRLRDDRLVVTQIHADSPAAASEIKPGWVLKKIGKRTAEEILETATKATSTGPMKRPTMVGLMCRRLLSGKPDQAAKLVCTDLDGTEKTVEVRRVIPPGNRVRAGNMPAMRITMRSTELPDGIGYFAFNAFFDPIRLITSYQRRLESSDTGIVIDLRGNVGGLMSLPTAMGSRLASEAGELGTMQMRGTKLKLALNPWSEPFGKPVAVLIDECSISSAEIMAGGLQDLGLAKIFGTTTAGLALPSTFEKLPNGDGFQYAMADYHSASGKILEGKGVTPDVKVSQTTDAFKADADPVMAQAIAWIISHSKSK